MQNSIDKQTISTSSLPEQVLSGTSDKQENFDQKIIAEHLKSVRESYSEIKTDFEMFKKEQTVKIVEFLGVFTAIISFIAISVNIIIKGSSLIDMMILMPIFALSLMLFVLALDILIRQNDRRGYWLLMLFLLLLSICGAFLKYSVR